MIPIDFSPRALYEIAKKSPIVAHCLNEWYSGRMTWEDALACAVVGLYRHIEGFEDSEEAIEE